MSRRTASVKRLITKYKWKTHLRRRSLSQLRKSRMFSEYRRVKNTAKSGQARLRAFKKTKNVDAPEVFSLVQNPNESVRFLNQILALASGANVFVNLADVKRITPEAIAALLARIHLTHRTASRISGNLPTDPTAKDVLYRSGFRDYVRTNDQYQQYDLSGRVRKRSGSVETVQTKYDQLVALELIEFAMERLTGTPKSHGPSFAVYGELMLNTLNHASAQGGQEPWWASVYCDKTRRRACFTFIDQGVGIFGSHRLNLALKISSALRVKSRAEILSMLFKGEIPSSTRVPGRGNGIPGMYNHCKAKRISNLLVLSNNAAGNAESGRLETLRESFGGTIVYWEIVL
jgi:hypothetical protein